MFSSVVSLKQAASLCAAAYRAAWIAGVSSALTTLSIDAVCIGAARWAATSIRNCMLHNALVFLIAAQEVRDVKKVEAGGLFGG